MPLIGSTNSGQYTPADVARRRALAQQLLAGQQRAVDPLSAIAQTLSGSLAGYENRQASEAETAGRSQFNQSLAEMLTDPNVTLSQLAQTAGDPWANSQQQSLIAALMGQEMDQNDPLKQVQLQQAQLNLEQDRAGTGQDMSGYGTTVYMGRDENGNPIPMRVSPQGMSVLNMPEGTTWDPGGIAGERAESAAIGKGEGEAQLGAAGDVGAADVALNILDQIEVHPGLQFGTGWQAQLGGNNVFPDRIAFQKLVDQAKSGAFLTAIQQLRGLGALSNAEGQTATAAITRMDTAMEDADFIKALQDYRAIIQRGRQMALEIINGTRSPLDAPAPLPATPQDNGQAGTATNPAKPTTEEQYNALPSGAIYIDPDDGKKYRKP